MTQIANLRQIDGATTLFRVPKNAEWTWSIPFPYPAGPQVLLVAAATLAAGNATITELPADTVAALVTGQPVAGYGIPAGATITAFPAATSVQLSAPVTQTGARVGVTFQALPLDLTGISFRMQVKKTMALSDAYTRVDLSTENGLLLNGLTSGVLSASVPPSHLTRLSQDGGPYVADLVARAADGGPVNLMARSGPATVAVVEGVTRP